MYSGYNPVLGRRQSMDKKRSSLILRSLAKAVVTVALIAFVLTTAIAALHAQRWRIVMMRLGTMMDFLTAVRLVLIGYFFNQTLPSAMGGDAFRVWGTYRSGIALTTAASSVIIDRFVALLSLMVMIAVGMRWLFDLITEPLARSLVVLVVACGFVGLAVLLALNVIGSRLESWRATRFLLSVAAGTRAVFTSARATIAVASLTITGYVVASWVVHLLAAGLAIDFGVGQALLLIPLVTLVTVLPVSIGGWGLRESAMVVALGLIGVPAIAAFSLSVLYGLVVLASGIPGGVIWLMSRRPRPADAKTQALS